MQFGGGSIEAANAFIKQVSGEAIEIIAELEIQEAAEVGLKVRKGAGHETLVGVRRDPRVIFVDRNRSGTTAFHEAFPGRHAAPIPVKASTYLHIFVDRSSVEVFGENGEVVVSDRIFPDPAAEGLDVYSSGGSARVASLEVWKLKSAWTKPLK